MIEKLGPGSFFGSTARRYDAAGVTLSESRYQGGTHLPTHSHAHDCLGVVLSGGYDETYERHERRCSPLTIVSHPAGERHAQRFHSPGHLFRVECEAVRRQTLPAREFRGREVSKLALRLRHEFLSPDSVAPIVVEGIGLELIAVVTRGSREPSSRLRPAPHRWVGDARDVLVLRLQDPPTLVGLARIVGVHPVTLSREFRRRHGQTIGDFIRGARIEFASRRLRESDPLHPCVQADDEADADRTPKGGRRQLNRPRPAHRRPLGLYLMKRIAAAAMLAAAIASAQVGPSQRRR